MMQFIEGVLSGAPIWVWPLLLVLVLLGLRSSKTRSTPMAVIYALPFLGAMTLGNIMSLPQPAVVWTAFGIGYLLMVAICFGLQKCWIIEKSARRVTLKGEWLTMGFLMIMFWANFVSGTVQAISPATYASIPFLGGLAVTLGAASGSFLGRSMRVIATKSA
ncbi:MAG: hypothetical protein AB8B60_01235 [Sulfitobacter sp.]